MARAKPSGIAIRELVIGTGPEADRTSVVRIHYRLFLNRGDLVQDTWRDGCPHTIELGRREAIDGLRYGLIGMRVGGRRELIVSPHLAYRDSGVAGKIPPNAVLRFEMELLAITPPGRCTLLQ